MSKAQLLKLIHNFLAESSYNTTAESLLKEARQELVQDNVIIDHEINLMQVWEEYIQNRKSKTHAPR